jgi:uncharacterized membrane protein
MKAYLNYRLRLKVFAAAITGLVLLLMIIPVLLRSVPFSLRYLDFLMSTMVVLVVIAFVFAFVNAIRVARKIRGKIDDQTFMRIVWAPALAIVLGFAAGMFSDLMASSARIEIKSILQNLGPNASVMVNGRLVGNPGQVIATLETVAPLPAHQSHTTVEIHIEVTSGNQILSVFLERDSSNNREYWFFYPKYKHTSKIEVGRLITDVFDDY